MSLVLQHPFLRHFGRDRRGPGGPYFNGVNRGPLLTMLSDPVLDSDLLSTYPAYMVGQAGSFAPTIRCLPFVVPAAPFSEDDNGVPFPEETVFVVFPDDTSIGVSPGGPCNLIYYAGGIPNGSTGSGVITDDMSMTIATFSIPFNGTSATVIIPEFTNPSSGGFTVTVTWSAGNPVSHYLTETAADGFDQYWAVPTAIPDGWTLRQDTDFFRGGTFNYQFQNPKLLKGGPNLPIQNLGFAGGTEPLQDGLLGIASGGISGNIWNANALWAYGFPCRPVCKGTACPSVASVTYLAAVGGFGSGGTYAGFRAAQVVVTVTGTPDASATVDLTIKQDGTTVWSAAASGPAAIMALAGTTTVTVDANAAGTSTTFTATGSGSSGSSPGSWSVTATMTGSPRCDLPFPVSVFGAGALNAPGAIDTAALATPPNVQPLSYLAAGVTSEDISSDCCLAFVPAADGWYQVLLESTLDAQPGVGEDCFGWASAFLAAPGHAGRPFYVALKPSGSDTAFFETYDPPSPTVCSSGGTAVTLSNVGGWAWAQVTLPSAGLWWVHFASGGGLAQYCGFTVDYSFTDPTVVNPDNGDPISWQPVCEWFPDQGVADAEFTNDPPGSPADGTFYIVGPAPTGAFVGQSDKMALWDTAQGVWLFITPVPRSIISDLCWYDGDAWHFGGTDPQLSIPFITAGSQVVYFLLGLWDAVTNSAFAPQLTISWGTT